jgi:hypothetical protein
MAILLIAIAALFAAVLTLFSGFGLGTLLMPVFALFFPLPLAIAATAVVHLANNLFKFALLAKQADWQVVVRFALPALVAAIGGASLLVYFEDMAPLASYMLGSREITITVLNALIGTLIVMFSLLELWPRFQQLAFPRQWLVAGGLLSGFFGGLSGHQGAFRSAFLIKAGMSKEAFVATGVVAAVLVDSARLGVYGATLPLAELTTGDMLPAILAAILCAFAGSFLGNRLLRKVTLRAVQLTVAVMMLVIGLGLASGLI